jgi:hypothetical protein
VLINGEIESYRRGLPDNLHLVFANERRDEEMRPVGNHDLLRMELYTRLKHCGNESDDSHVFLEELHQTVYTLDLAKLEKLLDDADTEIPNHVAVQHGILMQALCSIAVWYSAVREPKSCSLTKMFELFTLKWVSDFVQITIMSLSKSATEEEEDYNKIFVSLHDILPVHVSHYIEGTVPPAKTHYPNLTDWWIVNLLDIERHGASIEAVHEKFHKTWNQVLKQVAYGYLGCFGRFESEDGDLCALEECSDVKVVNDKCPPKAFLMGTKDLGRNPRPLCETVTTETFYKVVQFITMKCRGGSLYLQEGARPTNVGFGSVKQLESYFNAVLGGRVFNVFALTISSQKTAVAMQTNCGQYVHLMVTTVPQLLESFGNFLEQWLHYSSESGKICVDKMRLDVKAALNDEELQRKFGKPFICPPPSSTPKEEACDEIAATICATALTAKTNWHKVVILLEITAGSGGYVVIVSNQPDTYGGVYISTTLFECGHGPQRYTDVAVTLCAKRNRTRVKGQLTSALNGMIRDEIDNNAQFIVHFLTSS